MNDIGVVMPVYNQVPEYLRMAINSILTQTYKNFKFIIVIDGASKETISIIREETKNDKRVVIINKENNEGVSKALNTGFDHLMKIDGVKYLTWVSSDNIYYKVFLETHREALETGPKNLGLVFSSFRHVDENGRLLKNPSLEDFRRYQNQPKEKLLDFCLIGTSFMYKKEFAIQIDGYSMEPVEDYEYWLRLTEICEIKYIAKELMDYRVNSPQSISIQLSNSLQHQRRWRYKFNLARQQARNRRNIPFELTIIFPVLEVTDEIIKKLEEVYDQSFSNYKIFILDISLNGKPSAVLSQISDPRTAFFKLPNIQELEAIKIGVKAANTPYTILFGKGYFPSSVSVLSNLITFSLQLEKQYNNVCSYDNNGGAVSFRNTCSTSEPIYGQLYKTKSLIELFNS